jgi:hypothetical protein
MSDVIFKLASPLWQLRGHDVNSTRREYPARRLVFDSLAEDELMWHVWLFIARKEKPSAVPG